jgi:SAM-dependent methyltransferase
MREPQQQDVYAEWGRDDVLPYVPPRVRRVLEVGCGRGGFGRSLRDQLGPEAVLVALEPVESQAAIARAAGAFDRVHTGYYPEDLPSEEEPFDLICFNDVLEHIVDPWSVLRRAAQHLGVEGRVLAAIPNVQHGPTVARLLRGRWDYEETGILDRTHVRFFTRATALDLFRSTGYVVETCAPTNSVFDQDDYRRWAFLRPVAGDFGWMHFVIVARRGQPSEDVHSVTPTIAPVPGRTAFRRRRPPSLSRRAARRVKQAVLGNRRR